MDFGGFVISFRIAGYNRRAACTGKQGSLVENRSEPKDLVRQLLVCIAIGAIGLPFDLHHASE